MIKHDCHCVTPCTTCHCKPMRSHKYDHLLKKPLKDHLSGLLNRVDLLPDDRIKQALHDCILFILVESSRLDQVARRLL